MGIFDRLRQRRQNSLRNLRNYQRERDKVIEGRLGQLEIISKNLNKRQRNININTPALGTAIQNSANYPMWGCPFFNYNAGYTNDEPFGWARGTVRGMITLWTVLGFLLAFLMGYIPVILAVPIISMIVGSYFVGRARIY